MDTHPWNNFNDKEFPFFYFWFVLLESKLEGNIQIDFVCEERETVILRKT